jgi:putative ABC transport system permease protein
MDALRAHKLRTALTILGLMMGVATLITVVTLIQGANVYVETKVARLGTDVFQLARTPFAVTDFELVMKALRHRHIRMDDYHFIAGNCTECGMIGASGTMTARARYRDQELQDVSITGHTANMATIDTRTVETGRYFSEVEEEHAAAVCLIGATLNEKLLGGRNAVGQTIRLANREYLVIGTFEKLGSVLGQDADNYAIVPLSSFLQLRGSRFSLTLNVKVPQGGQQFERAQDQARQLLRARRHLAPNQDDDFYIGTKESYMQLWQQISGAFFAVFILVSSISAIVGGVVIMNVMLVSVTERTKEIGIRRAVGAGAGDILRQFLTESVMQCLVGGALGILAGFFCALLLREFTAFPASVQGRVAALGIGLSSAIGLFFGIYPASRAAALDPVEALRAE